MPTHARHRAASTPRTTRRHPRAVRSTATGALRLAVLALLVPALLGLTSAATGAPSASATGTPAATRTWIGGSQTVDAGRSAVLTAALGTASGPVAGRKVVVYQSTASGWRGLTSATTDAEGRIRITVRPSATTRYGAGFAGDSAYARSSAPDPVTVTVETSFVQRLLAEAAKHRGKAYRYGAAGPNNFDCSGYIMYVFSKLGKKLPHNSRAMYDVSQKIPLSELRPGDLVFTKHGGTIGHVGLFSGNGMQWHSPQSGDVVKHSSLYSRDIVAGRIA